MNIAIFYYFAHKTLAVTEQKIYNLTKDKIIYDSIKSTLQKREERERKR
jgi:hypothetical protein